MKFVAALAKEARKTHELSDRECFCAYRENRSGLLNGPQTHMRRYESKLGKIELFNEGQKSRREERNQGVTFCFLESTQASRAKRSYQSDTRVRYTTKRR